MLKVSKLMSQKIGVAPRCSTTLAVETQVNAGRITSSPGFTPKAAKARCIPLVQDVTAKECLAPVNLLHLFSKSLTCGPCTSQPLSNGIAAALRLSVHSWHSTRSTSGCRTSACRSRSHRRSRTAGRDPRATMCARHAPSTACQFTPSRRFSRSHRTRPQTLLSGSARA